MEPFPPLPLAKLEESFLDLICIVPLHLLTIGFEWLSAFLNLTLGLGYGKFTNADLLNNAASYYGHLLFTAPAIAIGMMMGCGLDGNLMRL